LLSVYFHPKTIVWFHNIFLGLLLYYLVVNYTKNVKSVLKFVVVVAFLNTIFSILQFFDINLIYSQKPDIVGMMSYKTHLGIYQAISLPICYVLNPWLAIIPAIGLVLSKSATAMIPAIIGMVYLSRKRFYSMPNLMLLMSCIVIFGGRVSYKLGLRLDVWIKTLDMIRDKLFLGYGIGVFNYIDAKGYEFTDPYSLYLEIGYALGIFGVIALLVCVIGKFKNIKHIRGITRGLVSACLILAISGLGYSFMDYPRLAGTAIVLFGLLTIKKGERDGKSSLCWR
jgi:O-antigen ligase